MLSTDFIWLALAITIFGNSFYIRDTLKGETQPNRVTFLLWGAAPLVAFFAQREAHVGIQILYTLIIALLPLIILACSFVDQKAYWKITRFDIACGALSIIALVVLIITDGGISALALSIMADFCVALPTIIKSYKHPESETATAYAAEIISAIIVLMTIQKWSFINFVFPAYILFMCLVFTTLLVFPRKKHNPSYRSK